MSKKYTEEQRQSYCTKWKTSKLSQQRFCKQENISDSSLSKWLKIYNQATEVSKPPTKLKFLEVDRMVNEIPKSESTEIEILLPNGVLIKTETTSVAEIIKELLI